MEKYFNGSSWIADICGFTIASVALVMNGIAGWINEQHINQMLTVGLSFVGLIFLIIRSYNTFANGILKRKKDRLEIKKIKQELNNN